MQSQEESATILSLFRQCYKTHFKEDDWSQSLFQLCQRKILTKNTVESLLKKISFPDTPLQQLYSIRKLASIIFLTYDHLLSFRDLYVPYLEKNLEKFNIEEFYPVVLLKNFLASLFSLTHKMKIPILTQKGGILVAHKYWDKFRLPIPKFSGECAAICALYGKMHKDTSFEDTAIRLADWYLSILDFKQKPFMSLWTREKEYEKLEILLSYYTMFYSVGHLFQKSRFLQVLPQLRKRIADLVHMKTLQAPIYFILLEYLVDRTKGYFVRQKEKTFSAPSIWMDPSLGVMKRADEMYSSIFTLSGSGTSLGSFHKEDAKIVAFGPQSLPLENCQSFGHFRIPAFSLNDVTFSESQNNALLKGWTKFQIEKNKNNWLEFEALAGRDFTKLSFSGLEEEDLWLSFYIQADHCSLSMMSLKPASFS